MAFTYSLPLQFQDFFFYHLPISIWACINMYKSLLRKNRIPSTALESLKGALSCFNFFSCSHETVSISAGGVLSLLAPTKTQASSTLFPHDPQILLPSVERAGGEGSPGQGLAMALEEGRAWQSLMRAARSSILVKQVAEQHRTCTPSMSWRLSVFTEDPRSLTHTVT